MNVLRLLCLLALIASVAACSDSVPAPPGTGGTTGTGATSGTGATVGTGATGGSGGVGGMSGAGGMAGSGGMGGATSGDACSTEPGDLEVIQMTTPNLRYWASRCATLFCENLIFEREMFVGCVTSCVQQNTTPSDQLTSECVNCYGELAWCAGINCNTLCSSTLSAICDNNACIGGATGIMICSNYGDCLTELNDCAGRNSLDCGD